jgi:hypothetical protein
MRSALVLSGLLAGAASADIPQMGGQQVFVSYESPHMSTVALLEGSGNFEGAASVLNGMGHNSQFGWLVNGTVSLPPNSGVFVRTLSTSPHLSVYSEFGYDPILGTDGSDTVWQWNGQMTHNWYASDVMGTHAARYEVFVGDLLGNPLDGWVAGDVELNFTYGADLSDRIGVLGSGISASVPAPGSLVVLSVVVVIGRRRRG